MSRVRECVHEADVLDLVAIGQWPARASADVRAHVSTCRTCGEAALVAGAILEWAETDPAPERLPDAAVIFRRVEQRAREEATRQATRPVAIAAWASGLVALAAVIAAVAWGWPRLMGGPDDAALLANGWAFAGNIAALAWRMAASIPSSVVWSLGGLVAVGALLALLAAGGSSELPGAGRPDSPSTR